MLVTSRGWRVNIDGYEENQALRFRRRENDSCKQKGQETPSWAGLQNTLRTSLFIHLLRIAEARTKLYVTLAPTLFLFENYDATELYK